MLSLSSCTPRARWVAAVALLWTAVGVPTAAQSQTGHDAQQFKIPTLKDMQEVVDATSYFQRQVDEHVEGEKLSELHAYAFAARDASSQARNHADAMDEARKGQLNMRLARIKTIATQLDKYGDAAKLQESRVFARKLAEEVELLAEVTGLTPSPDWKPEPNAFPHRKTKHTHSHGSSAGKTLITRERGYAAAAVMLLPFATLLYLWHRTRSKVRPADTVSEQPPEMDFPE